MFTKSLISVGIVAAMTALGANAYAATFDDSVDVATNGAYAAADPLFAIEANRIGIVNRLLVDHATELAASGVSPVAFRNALMSLRADQLLAASLVNSFAEVTAIVAQPVSAELTQPRFVPLTPVTPLSMDDLPPAEDYVVRDGNALRIVRSSELPIGKQDMQVVGYIPPVARSAAAFSIASAGPSMMASTAGTTTSKAPIVQKDGSGSGPNSWIGFVAGHNTASGTNSAVAAGANNRATNLNSFVGAGQSNSADGVSSLVVGGFDNHAIAIDSTVVAGAGNRTTGARSVVIGGGHNLASGQWSFIGGGGRQSGSGTAGAADQDNVVTGNWASIAGGIGNRASGNYAFIGGGAYNKALNNGAVVVGGNNGLLNQGNTASGLNSFVGAGFLNVASGSYSAIFAGHESTASGNGSVILGGHGPTPGLGNIASGESALVTTGYSNVASGNFSAVLSGHNSTASGLGSVAIGIQAKTEAVGPVPHNGAFVFSDGSSGNFRSTGARTFNILATGGARIVTAATNSGGEAVPSAGVTIAAGGGSWTSLSDRAAKKDIVAADPQAVLAKVAAMPVYTWRYITEVSGALHMGPTAQDFHAAFDLGDSDRSITNVDADGVALAAIKGINQKLEQKDAEIAILKNELVAIKAKLGIN